MSWVVVAIAILYIAFDINYFIRAICTGLCVLIARVFKKEKLSILYTSEIHGITWTSDLDLQGHMNNSRYLRECDFGRYKLFFQLGLLLGKGTYSFVNASNSIRYRKSLDPFTRFILKTQIIYWDDKAFYIEQSFVRKSDQFVCAINICKLAVLGGTATSIAKSLPGGSNPPECSEELKSLINSWALNSGRLKKTS